MKSLVIGAAGAIGKQLVRALLERDGDGSVVCALRRTPLPEDLSSRVVQELGIDVCDGEALRKLLLKYKGEIGCVWNLAAPLSVETAQDPSLAHSVTVGGMKKILEAMDLGGVKRICFTDSIGSFGAEAPRNEASARWLVENPEQDPGSDYGLQKRGCRELLASYAARGIDTRWAVVPGVLHCEATWGAGTTEYALDAIKCAHEGKRFCAPLDKNVKLPMIFADDLIRGLLLLEAAPRESLQEPEQGYAISGFAFAPEELYAELERAEPSFDITILIDQTMSKFAALWPDSLSAEEAERDFGFRARVGLRETVTRILNAHSRRSNEPDAKRARTS